MFKTKISNRSIIFAPLIVAMASLGSLLYYFIARNTADVPMAAVFGLFIVVVSCTGYVVHICISRYNHENDNENNSQRINLLLRKMNQSIQKEQQYIEQLHTTNHQLQQANEIIEKSSIIVFDWSLAPGVPVKYVSNNIRLFGYEPEEFYSNSVDYWDIVHPDDLAKAQEAVWGARRSRQSSNNHRYRIICKDGEIRWVEEWTLLERDSSGELIAEKGIITDVTDRVEAEVKIRHLSFHDKLTGVYNRAYYEQCLVKLDNPQSLPLSIILGDMNGLKLANDAFGHKQGDKLLIATANIIRKVLRDTDILARVGGDEFSLILPNTDGATASKICSEIRHLCRESTGEPVNPSVALGYATKTDINTSIDAILKEADDNMYKNKLNESNSIRSGIISSLKATLEEKTMETKEHAERLKEVSLTIGRALEFPDNVLDELAIASLMHDIGKIGIPDSILLKPGKLDEDEWTTMKKHPEIGYHIILSSPKLASVADYILAHHERWDGKGYPRGLKEQEIPIISRIIAIADSFDVMTHNRPYTRAMTKKQALEEIISCSGSQFDPHLVEVFCKVFKDIK